MIMWEWIYEQEAKRCKVPGGWIYAIRPDCTGGQLGKWELCFVPEKVAYPNERTTLPNK